MSLLIESTSHSQLGGRGACSPDVELANPRRARYLSMMHTVHIYYLRFERKTVKHGFLYKSLFIISQYFLKIKRILKICIVFFEEILYNVCIE